jgi:ATP phosphoribosyltransferase regulatory subunit
MVEYLEALLPPGSGTSLELQTFKLTDQVSGRTLGVRADMTPQVARIDAHHRQRQAPSRLCYLGTVLHTRPNNFASSRAPMQMGAELYGYQGVAADVEMISLMLALFDSIQFTDFCIDIGHVQIYQDLVQQAQLTAEQQTTLLTAVKRKAAAEVQALLQQWSVSSALQDMLLALLELHGDAEILTLARDRLAAAPDSVQQALDDLSALQAQLPPNVNCYFDLAESRGYRYHSGVIFAVYTEGQGQAIAKGGRYDGLCRLYGRDRPATGFSTNLRLLATLLNESPLPTARIIFAPAVADAALMQQVKALRQAGETVINGLPDQAGHPAEMGCSHELRQQGEGWAVHALTTVST